MYVGQDPKKEKYIYIDLYLSIYIYGVYFYCHM